MSEEKQSEKIEIVDEVVKTHTETSHLEPATAPVEPEDKSKMSGMMTPVVFLLFMIFAMIVVLVVTNMNL